MLGARAVHASKISRGPYEKLASIAAEGLKQVVTLMTRELRSLCTFKFFTLPTET